MVIDLTGLAGWIAAGGGSIILGVLSWFTAKWATEKADIAAARERNDLKEANILAKVESDKKELRDELSELRGQTVALREELHAKDKELSQITYLLAAGFNIDPQSISVELLMSIIKTNFHMFEAIKAFVRVFPALIWIKRVTADGRFVMVQCSEVFAKKYVGKPASHYSGRYDSEIFGEEDAAIYAANDLAAIQSGKKMPIIEPANSPMTGVKGTIEVWKIGFRGAGDQFVFGFGNHINPDGTRDAAHSLTIY